MSGFPLAWRPRAAPLEPSAVVVEGAVAHALLSRLAAAPRPALSGVASPRCAVILGERARLPWVDGARYLGCDPRAPRLLLPTTLEPILALGSAGTANAATIPAPLEALEKRLCALNVASPIAVLDSGRLISVAAARPLDGQVLAAWLAASEIP